VCAAQRPERTWEEMWWNLSVAKKKQANRQQTSERSFNQFPSLVLVDTEKVTVHARPSSGAPSRPFCFSGCRSLPTKGACFRQFPPRSTRPCRTKHVRTTAALRPIRSKGNWACVYWIRGLK
jgi:hypothetical protein